MPGWADISIDPSRVKALSQRLINRTSRTYDPSEITTEREDAAKMLLWWKMRDPKVGGLSQYVDSYDSPGEMLDAIADKAELADDVQDMLALAFLVIYLRSKRNTALDVMSEDAAMFEADLDLAVRAFAGIAPFYLAHANRTGPATGGGGALASTMGTYDY